MAPSSTEKSFFAKKMTLSQLLTSRLFAVVLVIGMVAAGWFLLPESNAEEANQDLAIKPQTVFVKTTRLSQQSDFAIPVWYTGEVRARRKTMVAFQRAGMVSKINFDEGDLVTTGLPIATLDSRQVSARMDQLSAQMRVSQARLDELKKGPRVQAIRTAQANVNDFQQQLANAELDLERAGRLLSKSAVSQQEYDQAKYRVTTLKARIDASSAQLDELKVGTRIEQVDAAEATLKSARSAAEIAEHDFDDCTLKAPFTGTITRRMVDEGTVLDTGTPVFELVESDHLEMFVGLPVNLARSLNLDDQVAVDIDGLEIKAKVKSKLLALDARTRTQTVILSLASSAAEKGIVDGQMGRVRFETVTNEVGFVLPTTAIVNDQQGLWNCYSVETDGNETTVKRQSVEVLHFQGDFVFVRGTLNDGQTVVTEGLQRLTSGQVVQLAEQAAGDVE